jgi:hypothetical protein
MPSSAANDQAARPPGAAARAVEALFALAAPELPGHVHRPGATRARASLLHGPLTASRSFALVRITDILGNQMFDRRKERVEHSAAVLYESTPASLTAALADRFRSFGNRDAFPPGIRGRYSFCSQPLTYNLPS